MYRWYIINFLIKKNNYNSYLEIGYYKGWSFDRVEGIRRKDAIDPNPCKTSEQERSKYGSPIDAADYTMDNWTDSWIWKMTSDEFFVNPDLKAKWDLIFVDGLHKSEQVDKDIENSLKHLNPGGTIVMHDCNPSSYEMTTTGTPQGEWCGDVYKSFIKFKTTTYTRAYVVDTDYGVGIIEPYIPANEDRLIACCIKPEDINWENFLKNRKKWLSLLSVDEFLELEHINQEVNA